MTPRAGHPPTRRRDRIPVRYRARLAVLALGLLAPTVRAASPQETLRIATTGQAYELSVPVGALVMTIPRGGFEVVVEPGERATASPRYFHLRDPARGIVISGWFEAARGYRGFNAFWEAERAEWTKGRAPAPSAWTTGRVGQWEAAFYDLSLPVSNTHVRAEWVEAGTWIDVHISVTTARPIEEARATALSLLQSIGVRESR